MAGNRAAWLLRFAETLCGTDSRRSVFEPLIADWHREWMHACGWQRARVLMAGTGAYVWSLMRLLDIGRLLHTRPRVSAPALIVAFAAAGTAASFQPLHYTWIGWGLQPIWIDPAPALGYFVPNALAHWAGFALLPALLLGVQAGWSGRRRVTVVALTLLCMALVDGWMHPALMRARSETVEVYVLRPGMQLEQDIERFASTSEIVRWAFSRNESAAAAARSALREKAYLAALTVAAAALGSAIGVSGRRRGRRPSLVAAIGVWVAGTLLYSTVADWAWAVVILLSLPRGASFWIPSVAFAMIAGVVGIVALATPDGREAPV